MLQIYGWLGTSCDGQPHGTWVIPSNGTCGNLFPDCRPTTFNGIQVSLRSACTTTQVPLNGNGKYLSIPNGPPGALLYVQSGKCFADNQGYSTMFLCRDTDFVQRTCSGNDCQKRCTDNVGNFTRDSRCVELLNSGAIAFKGMSLLAASLSLLLGATWII